MKINLVDPMFCIPDNRILHGFLLALVAYRSSTVRPMRILILVTVKILNMRCLILQQRRTPEELVSSENFLSTNGMEARFWQSLVIFGKLLI